MNRAITKEMKQESGRELQRFLEWISDNPSSWYCITNPECSEPDIERCQIIINSLIDTGLYSIAYYALCTLANPTAEMERVNHRLKMECFLDIPVEALIDKIQNNLKYEVNRKAGVD